MRYIQKSGITNKSVSEDRGAYGFLKRSFPKGALTHHLGEAVVLPSAIVRFPKKRVEVIAYRHISS